MNGIQKLQHFVESKQGDTCVFTKQDSFDIFNRITSLGIYLAIGELTAHAIKENRDDLLDYIKRIHLDENFRNTEAVTLFNKNTEAVNLSNKNMKVENDSK